MERKSSELHMEGWLVKRKKSGETHIGGSKTKRYFRLLYFCKGRESSTGRDDQVALAYFRAPSDRQPKEWLKVKDIQSVVSVLPTEFTVVHPKRSYVLSAATKAECASWVHALLAAVRRAKAASPRFDPTSPACSSHSRDKRRILGSVNRGGAARVSVEEVGLGAEESAFY